MPRNHRHGEPALERWRDRFDTQPVHPTKSRSRERDSASASSQKLRTVAEAAGELGLSVHTIRTWIATRRLAHIRLGRAIRIPAAEIRRVIEENTVPAVEER
jgi:excisionase family DNA binding protein